MSFDVTLFQYFLGLGFQVSDLTCSHVTVSNLTHLKAITQKEFCSGEK